MAARTMGALSVAGSAREDAVRVCALGSLSAATGTGVEHFAEPGSVAAQAGRRTSFRRDA